MRLNKYIALAGVASRRKADELTLSGNVKVNGHAVNTPGIDIGEGDVVEVNGRQLFPETKKVYILLNKPKGFITSVSDEKDRPTVMDLVSDIEERIFPVGRLDGATTGMLVMTNDGDFAYRMTHPTHGVYKTYRAKVSGVLSKEKCAVLRKGVDIGGYVTAPAFVEVIKQSDHTALVDIRIQEGKNRQVRKMFSAVGNKVLELERTAIGEVRLGSLKQGHYRKLRKEEINQLFDR
ncbi:MAG: rRNA pseudouridine synthase [Clostridiales Family XIII bacterium]|jgi:23S rRNA pseudouridine2605 synthase|nr:rRNA pseudouridine synthase [Clostridiales Family XIII bacterium]